MNGRSAAMKRLIDLLREKTGLIDFAEKNKDLLIKSAVTFVVVIAGACMFIADRGEGGDVKEAEKDVTVAEETKASEIFVDVGGEVNEPAVVSLADGSRVKDAIEAAGGLTENADITDINRAAFVSDGEKIYIPPMLSDEDAGVLSGGSAGGDGKININTADSEELQELDGVGPVTAEKIIAYRDENGRFTDIEDIKNVSGIGDKTFEKLKDDIKVW